MNGLSPFSSSQGFLERIEEAWKGVTQAKIEGDVPRYFRCLEDIFRSTHPIFTLEECEACENKISVCEGHLRNSINSKDVSFWVAENNCDELKMMISKLLFKYRITLWTPSEKVSIDAKEDFL